MIELENGHCVDNKCGEEKKKSGSIVATNIANSCEKCFHAAHWELRRCLYCAVYEEKPYEVYFEGKPCPMFDEIDELPGAPKNN